MTKSLAVALGIAVAALIAAVLIGWAWGLTPSWSEVVPASCVLLLVFATWWRSVHRQRRS